jgi:protein-S-isoprenylcysteine O-methyltransferase Ste14
MLFPEIIQRIYAVPGKVARPATVGINLLKTLTQSLTMWLIFLLIGPLIAFQIESALQNVFDFWWRFASDTTRTVGVLLFLSGWILAWSSAWSIVSRGDGTPLPIACPRKLVICGPYRYVRNPMAMGSLWQGFAIGLFWGSPLILLYVFIGALMWNFGARPWEEHDLEQRFGDDYRDYKQKVKCWIPRLRPYEASESQL